MSLHDSLYLCFLGRWGGARLIYSVMFLVFVFSFTLSPSAYAKSNEKYGAIVIDADTGKVLYQDRADKRLHPASLTKMMTLLMTFDALQSGNLKLNDRVRISKHAASMVPSKLGLEPGSTIKVEDAIYALVTKSANDIAVALAEHLGRTEGNFARMMTRKAHSLGMRGTTFRNASGLHDPQQVTTPRDIAKLSLALIHDYPKYYPYFSTKAFTYQGKTYRNHNRLMSSYDGMDGLKTGYIQPSGFNLAASAVRNDRRLVGVVFGGRTAKSRNSHMHKLLDLGFKSIQGTTPLIAKNIPVPERKPAIDNYDIASADFSQQADAFTSPPDAPTEVPGEITFAGPLVASAGLINVEKTRNISSSPATPAEEEEEETTRWAFMDDPTKSNMFNRMIGEGDYDIAVRKRIETGLVAIAAHSNALRKEDTDSTGAPPSQSITTPASYRLPPEHDWSIQVGAYTSRDGANQAIARSLSLLPLDLKHSYPVIAPVQTSQGWIFRGRLQGYTKETADKACALLHDCITIPPGLYQ